MRPTETGHANEFAIGDRAYSATDYSAVASLTDSPGGEWRTRLSETIARRPVPLHLVGVGSELRKDDAAGLAIVSDLISMLGPAPAPDLKIHGVSSSPERLLSKLSSETGKIVIFDAVEASRDPGDVVFCSLSDTKYGFFATHNVPIRLVPGLAARERDIRLVGVQPGSLEVGEGLTEPVRKSVEQIVAVVAGGLGGKV